MDILSKVIKTFFGTKSDKDRKEIQPYVDRILALYPQIDALSNDELRARSAALRRDIAEEIRPDEERITELKGILEQPETSLEDKERHSREIDKLTKDIDDKIEKKLDEILPEAFAIMKSTARRFAENPTIEDAVRPRPGRHEGFRYDRGRQGRLFQQLGSRRQHRDVGHGTLRRAAFRRRRASQGAYRRDGDGRG